MNSQRCQKHSRYPRSVEYDDHGHSVDPAAHCPVCRFKRRARLLALFLGIATVTAGIVHELLSAFSFVDGWF